MTSTEPTIRFSSERERKSYQNGLAIVAKKLAGRPLSHELRQLATIAAGKALVAQKCGAKFYQAAFGTPPPATTAPAPRTQAQPSRRSCSTPPPVKTFHRYCMGKGLFG